MNVRITDIENSDFKITLFTTNELDILDNVVNEYIGNKPHIDSMRVDGDTYSRFVMHQLSNDISKDWTILQSYIRNNKINTLLKK